jgi:20S proteasome subunit alpha 7
MDKAKVEFYLITNPVYYRIYMVHDEVKDKSFELELSWVGEHTNGIHQRVPDDVFKVAESFAKESLKEDSDSDIDES